MDRNELVQDQSSNNFVNKCYNLALQRRFDISIVLSQLSIQNFLQVSKCYQQNLVRFGQKIADQKLEQVLISINNIVQKEHQGSQLTMPSKSEKSSLTSIVFVKKGQKEYQLQLFKQQKYERSIFFTKLFQQLPKKIKQSNIKDKKAQQELTKIYLFQNIHSLYSNQYGPLIGEYFQSIKKISYSFYRRKRECFPLTFLMKNHINSLKVFHIQFQKVKIDRLASQFCIIQALDLFKIIYDNRSLASATIKGVQIKHLQQFMSLANSQNINKQDQRKLVGWIKDFNPSKLLKLTISGNITFYVFKENIASSLNDLNSFNNYFYLVRDIKVSIVLGEWQESGRWAKALLNIWKILHKMDKIKIKISQMRLGKANIRRIYLIYSILFIWRACLIYQHHLTII